MWGSIPGPLDHDPSGRQAAGHLARPTEPWTHPGPRNSCRAMILFSLCSFVYLFICLFVCFPLTTSFTYLTERSQVVRQAGGGGEETGSLLSKEPNVM